jgi:hypothetical protein
MFCIGNVLQWTANRATRRYGGWPDWILAMWAAFNRQPILDLDAPEENTMSQGASQYPIAQFISNLMDEYGFSRVDFIQALGYRDVERGLWRLSLWMDRGQGYDRILKQIAVTYPNHADRLQTALMNTAAVKTAEADAAFLEYCKSEESTFVPFIHADGETTRPSSICIFGVSGGHRRWTTIEIPKAILHLSLAEQLAALPDLMAEYRRLYNGACPFFGKLVGFKFVRLVDHFQFDKEGQFIEHIDKPYRQGQCSIKFL